MNSLFKSKISINQINELEKLLVGKLYVYDESFSRVYAEKISKISKIYFSDNPAGIVLMREILDNLKYQNIKKKSNEILNLKGVKFLNKKSKLFEEIPLSYSNFQLKFIFVDHPQKFHKLYDLKNFQIVNFQIERIKINNFDKQIAEKILLLKNGADLHKLELENCFEIEFDGKFFYTILDFEDGNYVAVDKNGEIFVLNHDAEITIKKIADSILDFLDNFDGNKIELSKKLF